MMVSNHITHVLEREGPRFALYVAGRLAATAELHCYNRTWTMRKDRVLPGFRGRGFQRALIQHRLSAAKLADALRVRVWIDPTNSYSLNNYITEGFRFLPHAPSYFDDKLHVALEKTL